MIVCISVKISFSIAVSIYILLFISDLYSFVYKPLHVTVKHNVRDKIYRAITFTPKQNFGSESLQNHIWKTSEFQTKLAQKNITDKNFEKISIKSVIRI